MLWPKQSGIQTLRREETESEGLSWGCLSRASGGPYPGITSYVVATQILMQPVSNSNLYLFPIPVLELNILPIFIAFDGQGINQSVTTNPDKTF